jgi:prolyl oligopeptidase
MLRKVLSSVVAAAVFACAATPQSDSAKTPPPVVAPASTIPAPPATEARPVTEVLHGVTITDPYQWLEDQNSAETRAWIDKQNAYTDALLNTLPDKAKFASRIRALLSADQISTPIVRNGRYFFTKRALGQDLFSIYMRESAHGPDILLINPVAMKPKKTTNVGILDVTDDGRLLAYYVRQGGADETEVRFFDVDSRGDTGVPLASARYFGVSISPDRHTAYYTRFLGKEQYVYRRAITGGPEETLFGQGYGSDKIIGTSISDNGHYLLIEVNYGSAAKKTEAYLKDLTTDSAIKTIVNDLDAKTYFDFAGDTLVAITDWNAPNQRLMTVPASDPGRANWKEIVPENKNAALDGFSLAGGKVFATYLENVKPRVIQYNLEGKQEREIKFDTIGILSGVSGRWSSPVAFYKFSSFAVPSTIYTFDVPTGKTDVFFRTNVPVNSDQFTVEQVWYPSKDGTRIPMFLFYKKGLQRNGTNPALLTGYGGFNASQLPNFSATAITWAENGGVYALPNLRGGGEFGEAWHEAGMLAKKQNVFDDFAAAAKYLIDQRFTSREHLGVSGGSNGGLLVTALATQHPDLAKAVVVSYPLVDMVRYHKFLVGPFWVPEYGSADDPEQFKTIYAYSPYHHVVAGTKYPSMLFITGDADTRVAPLHARKAAALWQASTGSANPVMLRYHVSGGHSGGDPLDVQVNNAAETLSFLSWQLR